ncbi:MFS transporter [Macromonas nakdongensis]|uniref:MFS transporter n=1 Tax=Macromonas nakdongensis TaxID=1843082 RepID=UPI001E31FB27|nr:MFS transporter [Macromonas nakdongensis]
MSTAPAAGPVSRRQLLPFAALSAGYFAHIGFFNPYLPLWLKDLGYGLVAIGLMTSLQSATRLFAPYVWGWLSDHSGHRVWLLRYCASVALAVSLALWWEWGTVGLFVVLLLMFTHTSGMMPLSESVLSQLVSQGGAFDARRYGRVRLWGSLGFLVTVLVAGAWFERHGMGSFPAWTAATLLAVVASVWAMPDRRDARHAPGTQPPVAPVLRQPLVRWFFVAVFWHILAHVFIYIFFSLYLDALGYGKGVIGLLWAFAVVVEIGWFFTQGRWLPRLSLAGWLVLASGLMALRMGVTATAGAWLWALFAAQAVHAITFAAHHSVCIAWVNTHFPGRLRARGQALFAVLGYGLSGVLGGWAGGVVSSRWGLAAVFWCAAAAAVLATLSAWWLWRLSRSRAASGAAGPG